MKLRFLIIIIVSIVLGACSSGQDVNGVGDSSGSASAKKDSRLINNLMLAMPLDELVRSANHILYGKVADVKGNVGNVGQKLRMPISTVRLDIIESWKGVKDKTITFRSPGAVVNGAAFFSEQMPQFVKGEEVVVFLAEFDAGVFPVGHRQGNFEVKDGIITKNNMKFSEFKNRILSVEE